MKTIKGKTFEFCDVIIGKKITVAVITSENDEYGDEADGESTVGSWEDLPAGDYLDPDENGTNWFKANDGDHWYQNSDGTWTKWQD